MNKKEIERERIRAKSPRYVHRFVVPFLIDGEREKKLNFFFVFAVVFLFLGIILGLGKLGMRWWGYVFYLMTPPEEKALEVSD